MLPVLGCFDPTHTNPNDGGSNAATGSSDDTSSVTATSSTLSATSPQDAGDGGGDEPSTDASDDDDASSLGDASSVGDTSGTDGATSTSSSTGGAATGDTSTGSVPDCPNGVIDDGEDCDDDNAVDDDGCTVCTIDPSAACGGEPSICGASCDPLLQDCAAGCYAVDDSFLCAADASGAGGAAGDICDTFNACDPGRTCIDVEDLPDCRGEACCTPFCDLSDPDASLFCPGGLQCVEWFALGTAPPGFDEVGICIAGP